MYINTFQIEIASPQVREHMRNFLQHIMRQCSKDTEMNKRIMISNTSGRYLNGLMDRLNNYFVENEIDCFTEYDEKNRTWIFNFPDGLDKMVLTHLINVIMR